MSAQVRTWDYRPGRDGPLMTLPDPFLGQGPAPRPIAPAQRALMVRRENLLRSIASLEADPRYRTTRGAHAIAVRQGNLANIESQLALGDVAEAVKRGEAVTAASGPPPLLLLAGIGVALWALMRRRA